MKYDTVQMYYGTSVRKKNYFLHFRFQYSCIYLSIFQLLRLCAVTVFISEGITKFISLAVANMKSKLTNFQLPTII